ncbi:MAG: (2Fe-2S)-binding protein [Bradymonadia bacterium]
MRPRRVCDCFDVTEARIHDLVREGERTLDAVVRRTGAGTGCGACRQGLARAVRGARWRARVAGWLSR